MINALTLTFISSSLYAALLALIQASFNACEKVVDRALLFGFEPNFYKNSGLFRAV